MNEKIREVWREIEASLTVEADNANDRQCNDMTLNHLIIAREWQKRKISKSNETVIVTQYLDNKPIEVEQYSISD